MAKALVTGGSGFVGTHLTAALAAQGDDVTCLVRKTSKVDRLSPLGARFAYGDVTEPQSLNGALAGVDIVYHVAGCTFSCYLDRYYQVNAEGTRNLAKACAAQPKPPVLVMVSSLAAAGPARNGRPLVESDPARPVSHYGRSKRQGELAVQSFADRVPTTIVRPPIVFGEMDSVGFYMFRPVLRFGVQWVPGFRRNRFSTIHAADLVQLIIAAGKRGRRLKPVSIAGPNDAQGIYFAASELAPTYGDLARLIARAAGRRRIWPFPVMMPLIWTAGLGASFIGRIIGKPLPMTFDKVREIDAGSWICSADAARRDLDFTLGAPLVDRMRQTIEWYYREKWL